MKVPDADKPLKAASRSGEYAAGVAMRDCRYFSICWAWRSSLAVFDEEDDEAFAFWPLDDGEDDDEVPGTGPGFFFSRLVPLLEGEPDWTEADAFNFICKFCGDEMPLSLGALGLVTCWPPALDCPALLKFNCWAIAIFLALAMMSPPLPLPGFAPGLAFFFSGREILAMLVFLLASSSSDVRSITEPSPTLPGGLTRITCRWRCFDFFTTILAAFCCCNLAA